MFAVNQNKPERILRFILAVLMLPAPFLMGAEAYSVTIASVGGVLLFNAVSGACMTYKVFGVNTCSAPGSES